MPFGNRRTPMEIADTAHIASPSPKQIVHGLRLRIQLSELHLASETKDLKLSILLNRVYLPTCGGSLDTPSHSPAQQGLDLSRHCNELFKTFGNWRNMKVFKTYWDWLRDRLLYFRNNSRWLEDLLGNFKRWREFVIHDIMDDDITLFALSHIPVVLCSYSKFIRTKKLEEPFHQTFSVIPKHRPFSS